MFLLVTIKENVVFWFFDFRPLRVPNGATKFWEIRKNVLGQGSSDAYNFFVLNIIQKTQLLMKGGNRGYQKVFMSFLKMKILIKI